MAQVLEPTKNRVVCTHKESPEATSTGIIIPDQYRKVPQIAVVQAVGPEVEDFKPGDEVLYATYAGMEVNLDDTTYLVLDADDIVAHVVEELAGFDIEEGATVYQLGSGTVTVPKSDTEEG